MADRLYPSSKTCSACGAVKAELTLPGHTYTCERRGVAIERDENAARNEPTGDAGHVAVSGTETLSARGGGARPPHARPRGGARR